MKKIHISDYKKGLIFSLALHSLVVFALVFENISEIQTPPPAQKSIALALSSFTPAAPAATPMPQALPTPPKACKEKVAKHEKPKEHHKPKKHKKHEKHAKKPEHFKKDAPRKVEKRVEELAQTQSKEMPNETKATELAQQEKPQESLAQATPTQQTPPTPAEPSAAELQEQFVATNFEVIRSLVLQNLTYPSLAKRMQQTGIVEILLVINEQGKLIKVTLENSSGFKLLDNSAIKAAQHLADLNLPAPKNTSRILLPVAFALN